MTVWTKEELRDRAERAEAELRTLRLMIEADGRFVGSLENSVAIMLRKLEVAMRCW